MAARRRGDDIIDTPGAAADDRDVRTTRHPVGRGIVRTEKAHCRDCSVPEGSVHQFGCCIEVCPFCGWQLIGCGCLEARLDTSDCADDEGDGNYPAHVGRAWQALLTKKGRVPFIEYPNMCARCGLLHPEFFMVTDRVWAAYVQVDMRESVLCRPCFDFVRKTILEGRRLARATRAGKRKRKRGRSSVRRPVAG